MPRLVIEKGADKGKTATVASPGNIVVGRDPAAALRIGDSMCSRLHFRIDARGEGFYLVDLNSLNGTYLNGEKIHEKKLTVGDKIQVGESLMSFMSDAEETRRGGLVGTMLGGYKIEERIGRGGMGTVYRATQLSLNRIVALKILSSELTRDKTFINLFLQEARSAAQLNHPNIVQVYDVSRVPGEEIYYFSMEFVPGGSVQDLLSKEKRLATKNAIAIVLDAAKGLEYAEKKQLVHRDIKPDNMMIGEFGTVKIGDLGLAKSLKEQAPSGESQGIFGTPHYIAPEQAMGKAVDHRADIYSLGASMYRMLAGVTPYSGATIKEILMRKMKEEPFPLRSINQSVPQPVCDIVNKMMKKDPTERYQAASQVIADLESVLREIDGVAGTSTPLPRSPSSSTLPIVGALSPPRRRAVGIIGVLIVLCLLAVGGLAVWKYAWPHVDNRPPDIVVIKDDRYAHELFLRAAQAHASMNPQNEQSMRTVKALYEKVVTECPDAKDAEDAKKQIKSLGEQLVVLKQNIDKAARDKAASLELSRLKMESANALLPPRNASMAEMAGILEKNRSLLTEKYAKFAKDYDGTDAAKAALTASAQVDITSGLIRDALKRYASAEQLIRASVNDRKFGDALRRLRNFRTETTNTWVLQLVDSLNTDVRQKEQFAYDGIVAEAEQARGDRKFDEAKNILGRIITNLDSENLIADAANRIKAIDDAVFEENQAKQRERLRRDKANYNAALTDATALEAKFAFKGAMHKLEGVKKDFETDSLDEELASNIQDLRHEADLLENFKTQASSGKFASFKVTSIPKLANASIKKVTDTGIEFVSQISGGTVGSTIKWDTMSASDFYGIAQDLWVDRTASDNLDLAVFCMRMGLGDKAALDLLNRARTDDNLAEEINRYVARVEGKMPPDGKRRAKLAEIRKLEKCAIQERGQAVCGQLEANGLFFELAGLLSCMGEYTKSNDFLAKAAQSGSEDPRIAYGLHLVMQAKNIVMIDPAQSALAIAKLNDAILAANGNDAAMSAAVMTKCALAPEKLGVNLKRVKELSGEFEKNADPSFLWEMCRLMQASVPREMERRIMLKQLMEVFPKFVSVENGDCLAEYADSCFRFCDYALAKETYEKLKKEFPKHAVAVSRDPSGAGDRIKECEYWLEKLK